MRITEKTVEELIKNINENNPNEKIGLETAYGKYFVVKFKSNSSAYNRISDYGITLRECYNFLLNY